MIYIDMNGTIVNNAKIDQQACAAAVQRMSDAGHPVRLVSSLAGGVLCGRPIGDKAEALASLQPGDVLIDDERSILVAACRLGCITVPAEQLVIFADMLCARR